MCKCTPNIRTPWCGKPGCEAPPRPVEPVPTIDLALEGLEHREAVRRIAVAVGALSLTEWLGGSVYYLPFGSPDCTWQERGLPYPELMDRICQATGWQWDYERRRKHFYYYPKAQVTTP